MTQALFFGGCEWSAFKTKEGVTDRELILASEKMRSHFLNLQAGFIDHALLKGDDGFWVDQVFAKTKEDALQICNAFSENSYCLDYLALIDTNTVTMTFWQRSTFSGSLIPIRF